MQGVNWGDQRWGWNRMAGELWGSALLEKSVQTSHWTSIREMARTLTGLLPTVMRSGLRICPGSFDCIRTDDSAR